MLIVTDKIQIPFWEIEFSVARSSGPGGQNVNKVNSKVVLRWNAVQSVALPEEVKARFLERHGPKLTRAGEVLIASDRFRDQPKNREDCLERLKKLLLSCAYPPKKRRESKPTYSSRKERLKSKGHHSKKKALRGRVRDHD